MRSEELYLRDILEAAEAIAEFTTGLEAEDFLNDPLRQSAVLQKLIVSCYPSDLTRAMA
jgi:uncharacterized protein with HEPN domain